jgi:hypothetical protein
MGKKEFRRTQRQVIKSHYEKQGELLSNYRINNQEKFCQKCKIKSRSKVEVNATTTTAKNYYKEFFAPINNIAQQKIREENEIWLKKHENDLSDVNIDCDKISEIIENLPNGKAKGYDGTNYEMYKYSKQLANQLSQILEQMLKYNHVPIKINVGLIRPIIKDKNKPRNDMTNTRPITVSDPIPNIYEQYILDNVLTGLASSNNQFGIKKRCSCAHSIFMLKETIAWYKKNNKTVYTCAIDLQKAFDRMNREKLFAGIKEEISPKWYSYTTTIGNLKHPS